jgi:hypothetical protein
MVAGDEDEIILDCYRLARHYHVSPDVFLTMSVTELETHMRRTGQVQRADRPMPSEE